ncbi:hypothetical protein ACHAXH_004368, partial [Discostella pseudostelligera]
MDLHMPVMDGFEATKIIKSSNDCNIPVVALTSDTREVIYRRCTEIGFTKPLKEDQIKELLVRYVPGHTCFDLYVI